VSLPAATGWYHGRDVPERCLAGRQMCEATENAGVENAIRAKMQGWKCRSGKRGSRQGRIQEFWKGGGKGAKPRTERRRHFPPENLEKLDAIFCNLLGVVRVT